MNAISRRLGQHFLINKSAIKKIIAALDPQNGDTIIEIGPGHGELTREFRIQDLEFRIVAVEKDKKLAENLRKIFTHEKNIKIINDDIFKILPQIPKSYILNPKSYKVVGNIPYYITGKLLRVLSELEHKPELIVLTIQKEVAERITASNGMNLLAAATQFWAKPEIISYLKPADFSPPPKVNSVIIKLIAIPHTLNPIPYYKLIKILFKQPRKTLLNNLANGLKIDKSQALEIMKKIGLEGDERPQNLSLDIIHQLVSLVAK